MAKGSTYFAWGGKGEFDGFFDSLHNYEDNYTGDDGFMCPASSASDADAESASLPLPTVTDCEEEPS